MNQYDIIKYVWISDLYFMVQWFLPYIFKSILWMNVICGIMDKWDTKIDFIMVCKSVTYISWSIDFAYYFEDIWRMNIIFGIMDWCDTKIDFM